MRIGVMCSGNGTNFENIVKNCPDHEVVMMVHNKKECGALEKAKRLGIRHCRIKSKEENKMIELFKAWRVDLIVLAGYMRIIKNPSAFPAPMINIHPSLLPKHKGLNAVDQALESGDKITGCTVHYVNEELDGGQIIDQSVVIICPDDTSESLQHRIQKAEHRLLPLVINHTNFMECNKLAHEAIIK
tara:strand:- start:596 stop:1156 length:561 start_codon:yes stop_codon:yes gene_type:complete